MAAKGEYMKALGLKKLTVRNRSRFPRNLIFTQTRRLQWKGNLPFLLCFTLYSRANSKYKPPGGLIFGGAI